jgi:hypothetical protein
MKTFNQCKQLKNDTEFYPHKKAKMGLSPKCKECLYYSKKETILQRVKDNKTEDPMKFLLAAAKCRAKKEGVPFNLTREDLQLPTHCPVFGMELKYGGTGVTERGYGASPNAASIDRVDGKLGYTKDNVSIISWKANAAKCKLSVEELIKLADYFAKLKISIDNIRSTHYASTI